MEMDPLLKDLSDKNNKLRRNAVTMAMELKNTRCRLISKEKSFAREEERRMEAESTALKLEKELFRLQNHLDEKERGKHRLEKELKKRVLKLEFFLQETRSQSRRLHRILDKRDRVMKNLKREIEAIKEERNVEGIHGFWQSSSFKFAVTMSMVMLIALSRN